MSSPKASSASTPAFVKASSLRLKKGSSSERKLLTIGRTTDPVTPTRIRASVQEPWFTYISQGEKSVEGRLASGSFARLKANDVVTFTRMHGACCRNRNLLQLQRDARRRNARGGASWSAISRRGRKRLSEILHPTARAAIRSAGHQGRSARESDRLRKVRAHVDDSSFLAARGIGSALESLYTNVAFFFVPRQRLEIKILFLYIWPLAPDQKTEALALLSWVPFALIALL